MKKLLRTVMLMVVCFSFLFAHASAEQSISVGYGFGLLNQDGKSKQLEGGKTYDFIQALYSSGDILASFCVMNAVIAHICASV